MQHIRTEDIIIIDIETVSERPSFDGLNEDWKHLWEEKVERQLPEGVTAGGFYPMRAGIMAEFSKIVCISMGYFTKEPQLRMRVKSFYGHEEKMILLGNQPGGYISVLAFWRLQAFYFFKTAGGRFRTAIAQR